MKSKKSTRLGEILLEKGLLSAEQLDTAVHEQIRRRQDKSINADLNANTSLGEILIELGFIDRLALNRGLNWQSALRKIAIVMSFCAPLMTASYSAAAATMGAFTQPTFTARSNSSSAESKLVPSFTKSSSSTSSVPNYNSYSSASSVPAMEVVASSTKSSSSSSKSSASSGKAAGPDLIAPLMPNKISVVAALYNGVHLSWIPATDNVGVTRYRIYRDQIQIEVLESDQTNFVDFNVAPNKNYLYGVSAGDAVGNWSAIKSVFVLTAVAPVGAKVVSSSSTSSLASSSTSSVANIAPSSSSKAPTFTPSSSSAAALSSSSSSVSSKAVSSSTSISSSSSSKAVSSSSSSKAAVSSSSSSISSSAASSAASVAGPVNLNWTPPVARENGNVLDITEVGGYELRYRKVADNAYTYVTINDAWTNTYNFAWLDGTYVFQIAAFDKNGLYSNFVNLAPK